MGWPGWTGVGERRWKTAQNEYVQPPKTLWDLLQLLIVPAILVGIGLWWNASQTSRDNAREDRRIAADQAAAEQVRENGTLNSYIQQMSDLMLDKSLSSSKPGDPVRSVARTVTLTALRRLDGERKGEVVRFLQEARLILRAKGESRVNLMGADIARADLRGADLRGVELAGADLRGADLPTANLRGAILVRANLAGADLKSAFLRDADLTNANLTGANLRAANLRSAVLAKADLRDADLREAFLRGADLSGAKLAGVRRGAMGFPKGSR